MARGDETARLRGYEVTRPQGDGRYGDPVSRCAPRPLGATLVGTEILRRTAVGHGQRAILRQIRPTLRVLYQCSAETFDGALRSAARRRTRALRVPHRLPNHRDDKTDDQQQDDKTDDPDQQCHGYCPAAAPPCASALCAARKPSSPCRARCPSTLSGAISTTRVHDSSAPARSCLPNARMMP